MRTELILTNVLIFLLGFVYPAYECFNSILEDESADPIGPRFWWMFGGLALHRYLSASRASEEEKVVLAEYTEYLQDRVTSWKDDEGITVRHLSLSLSWSSSSSVEVAENEGITVLHLSLSLSSAAAAAAAAAATTVTGGGGGVEVAEKEGILDLQLVEFGEYILTYIPRQDPGFLQDRMHARGSEKEQEDGSKKAVIETPGSATDMTMQLCRRRRQYLWGMGTYEKKVRSFVESALLSDSLLGLRGIRGVGKSELLGVVHDYYHAGAGAGGASSYFHHVVLVSAAACTAGLIVSRAQHAIATALGLDTSTSLDEIGSRTRVIFNRLENQDERVLLLLDDVEEPFDLFHLGLPISSRRVHKIIYATRSQSVCAQMMHSADNTIEMRCLGQDDAWNLFQENVGLGIIDAHPQIHRLAKEMVEECRGLPLALCVIGRAMSSKSDVREWRNAYNVLKDKHSTTQENEGYSCLDILETQLKESFLVTSVWPQDGSIPKEMRSLEIPATSPEPKRRRRRVWWIMYLLVVFCQLMLSLASLYADFNDSFYFLFVLVQFLLNFINF